MRILFILFLFGSQTLVAQVFPKTDYPAGYFRNPLNIPILLSGNFGELRTNHYHMGLDIKTQARQNLPVYAAAEGYISRIKIEPGGFGRAIYINHPNGFTTLYAHLNNFNPVLESWVKQQQYQQESWAIYLELTPGQFPVKKGDFLAYSGSTGGSQAPHLHFEIRQTSTDVNLNPFLFGLPVTDNLRPRIVRLAVYDRTKGTYEQTPVHIPVKASSASFFITTPALIRVASPKVSFAIGAYDMHSGAANHIGIYEADLYMDEEPVTGFRMNNISYNDTRCVNAHIDYKTKALGGASLQQLFDLPGYVNSIYKGVKTDGVLDLSDGAVHSIRVEVKDAVGNSCELNYKVQYTGATVPAIPIAGKQFYPQMIDGFESPECEFYMGERCLYDSVHIRYSKSAAVLPQSVSSVHTIGERYIPLQESFLIRIQPTRVLTVAERSRTVMQWSLGARKAIQQVEWQENWATARFRDFGNYQLVVDTEPPAVVSIGFSDGANLQKASHIAFTIKDNLDVFKNVRTELDGKWLRFTNDKGRTFIYYFDERCPAGEHTLKISAEDEAGNTTMKTFTFTR
jgi:murein DD-endopeptidase MepM/ murein hydrolase activator NlpD